MQGDDALELVGQVDAVFGLAAAVAIAREVLGVRQMIDRDQVAEGLAIGRHAAHCNPGQIDAVITLLAADETRARCLPAQAVITQRNLQRRIDRLRP